MKQPATKQMTQYRETARNTNIRPSRCYPGGRFVLCKLGVWQLFAIILQQKSRGSAAQLCLELLRVGYTYGMHTLIGFQEVPRWTSFVLRGTAYTCFCAESCDCAILYPSKWAIRDSRSGKRYLIIAFEVLIFVSFHLCWWLPDDTAVTMQDL